MSIATIGIIVSGATSRIGSTQHLQNALGPLIAAGGLAIGNDRIVPKLLLVGRNPGKLSALAAEYGGQEWTTDLDAALSDRRFEVFFDAGLTHLRTRLLRRALDAGKHIYAEKPVVSNVAEGMDLLAHAEARGLKHGAVEDKLALPGLRKLAYLAKIGFFGRIISFRLEFGWWVFDGFGLECQRPSWNYRRSQNGGIVSDMHAHWRYVVEGILGPIDRVVSTMWTGTPRRVDEAGQEYDVDVEDSSSTLVALASGASGTILSSWASRVRRDELLQFHVDGTHGSAVAGLHNCFVQSLAETPKVRWSPNENLRPDYFADWGEVPDLMPFVNGYRAGWEAFLAHVATGSEMRSDLRAGIRDVLLAEACYRSNAEQRWVQLESISAVPAITP